MAFRAFVGSKLFGENIDKGNKNKRNSKNSNVNFQTQRKKNNKNKRPSSKKDQYEFDKWLPFVNWTKNDLKDFKKDIYEENEKVATRSQEEVALFHKNNSILVSGNNIPKPIVELNEIKIPEYIKKVFDKLEYKKPTPIQSQGWPVALTGNNVVGIAETGSGKTITYMLPAILHISKQPRVKKITDGPICLVLVPTRELAQQITAVTKQLTEFLPLRIACLEGGKSKKQETAALEKGTDILIATPGRLIDHIFEKNVHLRHTTYFVLDEADCMLKLGFKAQVVEIFGQIRPDRQVLMWSATMLPDLRKIAENYLCEYINIKIGAPELHPNKNITQKFEVVSKFDKDEKLKDLLSDIIKSDQEKTLIFTSSKVVSQHVTEFLTDLGYKAEYIHGGRSQAERNYIINKFRTGELPVLVATDLASRGLDVKDIKYVINYDFPREIENYIHRVGRTARGFKSGIAYTFFTVQDNRHIKDVIKILKDSRQEIDPVLQAMEDTYENGIFTL